MAEAAFDYRDFDEEETIEIPDGGIADFLTAKTGSWADDSPNAPTSGIAHISRAADQLAEFGRFEDEYLAHVAPNETIVPAEVLDENPQLKLALFGQMRAVGLDPSRYVVGNESNSINPITGQPEFFSWNIGRALKRGFKKVFKVIKRVLPKVLPVILAFTPLGPILGPMLGSGIGTLMEGGDWKDALKASAISGATAGIMRGIQGGIQGMRSGTGFFQGAGQTVGGDLSNIGARFGQATGISALPEGQSYWSMPSNRTLVEPVENVPSTLMTGADALPPSTEGPGRAGAVNLSSDIGQQGKVNMQDLLNPRGEGARGIKLSSADPRQQFLRNASAKSIPKARPELLEGNIEDLLGIKDSTSDPLSSWLPEGYDAAMAPVSKGLTEDALIANIGNLDPTKQEAPGFFKSIGQAFTPGDDVGFFEGMGQAFYPQKASAQEIVAKAGGDWNNVSGAVKQKAYALADKVKDPNFFQRFGPTYTASMLASYLFGDEEPETRSGDFIEEERSDMWDRLTENPGKYEPRMNLPQQYAIQQWAGTGTGAKPSIRWQSGATAARGGDVDAYPPRIGAISGPGTETSDDVPAMLSDGEFVFTAKSVRGAGGGSRQNGTQNLYNLMRNFEGRV